MALSFNAPVDIGNRALQHCGVTRMNATLGFTENSKNASAVAFVYDKLRRSELRRAIWRFSIKECFLRAVTTTTAQINAPLWASTTTYYYGALVADASGAVWSSTTDNNLNNTPGSSAQWELYFGPLVADVYSSSTTYSAGEMVYTTAGTGVTVTYRSLINNNTDNPATTKAYDSTVTYRIGQVVVLSAVNYQSLINFNTNNTPSASPAAWASGTTYAAGAQVCGSDGVIYTSNVNSNLGNDPTTDLIKWTNTGVLCPWSTNAPNGGSFNWRLVSATMNPLPIIYPINSGPASQTSTRNVFWLPANFLRRAAQNPKASSVSFLGSPAGQESYDDWLFESRYLVSAEGGPIRLRFAADIVDVTQMDEMFCEGLALRIALAVVEELTQSASKLQTIAGQYAKFMGEARTVNAIEIGFEDPPLDEYVACRV